MDEHLGKHSAMVILASLVLASIAGDFEQWGIDNVTAELPIIADLQKTLRKGEWKITCAVYSRAPGGGDFSSKW